MNRYKKLGILAAVLVVACVATLLVMRYEERKEQIRTSGEIVLEIDPDTVSALSWTYDGETLSFHRDEGWLYDGDGAFPVDEDKIHQRLALFEALSAAFVIEDVEDYGQYGLDKPVCTISLTAGDTAYEIDLGDYSKLDSQRYVSVGDGRVFLVKDDPLDQFDAVLRDMILHDEVPAMDEVQAVTFSGAETYTVQYQGEGGNSYREGDVWFVGDSGLPLDPQRVESYLKAVRGVDLYNYVTYNATQAELETYGLDAPQLTVSVEYTREDGGQEVADTFVLNISRDPEERQQAEEAAASGEEGPTTVTAYARVGESPIVYRLTSGSYTSLTAASYDDLRHREVIPAELESVSRIDVSLEGSTYTVTAQTGESGQKWYYLDGELESSDLQKALEGLTADSFTGEAPTQKEEIGLTLHLDISGNPAISVKLYRYDGTRCLAVVDGESVSLVLRSDVVALMEAVNAIVL